MGVLSAVCVEDVYTLGNSREGGKGETAARRLQEAAGRASFWLGTGGRRRAGRFVETVAHQLDGGVVQGRIVQGKLDASSGNLLVESFSQRKGVCTS